eukprot:CAMPEP_0177678464 /NCGR_PEP_ID=MMETSP0447-20121125/29021_1 /TAXON_ID=0 /ORGANISM="Stygamoeba regulata, Strain BSH-02190019" /LENGTH=602 /DNA_ID=CAMNT_0019187465 /DNA_START=146 /DNA_END=1954 /DNA_ORIENTATION=+
MAAAPPVKPKQLFASLPDTVRGQPTVLKGDPKGKNFVYCCGNSVIMRDIANPAIADQYCEHQTNPTVAAYAPSGYYMASGDSAGNLRIWDTVGEDRICKLDIRVIAGAIKDICWSEDSKRICAVGEGRDVCGRVFLWDSGASVGEISGHAGNINSCDFKQTRPYRIATGGEDKWVNWFEGPPFKFKTSFKEHTRWVNCVRFNKQGTLLASVGQDKLGFFYDGKTGESKGALSTGKDGHKGGIYACSWNDAGTQLLTASGDKTCKIWDAETGAAVTTFKLGNAIEDQQLGCLWQGEYLLTVGLNGHITYLDPNNPDKPIRTVYGHQKFVTTLAYDKSKNDLYSASFDSAVVRWNVETGEPSQIPGKGHQNQMSNIEVQSGNLVSASMDDSVRVTPVDGEFGPVTATDSPMSDVAVQGQDLQVACSMKSVYVMRNGKIQSQIEVSYNPQAVSINPTGDEVACAGDDMKVYIYALAGDKLTEKKQLSRHGRKVTCLEYSGDGKHLCSACAKNEIVIWKTSDHTEKDGINWCFHTATIKSVAFSPNGLRVASGSLDQNIRIWNLEDPMQRDVIKLAHRGGVNGVVWLDDSTIASCGQDCTLKTWTV